MDDRNGCMKKELDMRIAVVGGGPAGLMAAETALAGGVRVDLYDAMASVGRKFLLAGKGGLNLTHSDPPERFLTRYGDRRDKVGPWLHEFGPDRLRKWAGELGIDTCVGSSGRVFPTDMKAAPLLRAWLRRLRQAGLCLHARHRWCGWDEEGALRFDSPDGLLTMQPDAVIFSMGGGSWPKLGSDGTWVPLFAKRAVPIAPLQPANCGFDVGWSEHFRAKFAGCPVKTVGVVAKSPSGSVMRRMGEFVITETGVEGGVIYAVAPYLREEIQTTGRGTLRLDLAPDRELPRLMKDLSQPRGKKTMATHLQRRAHIDGVKSGLLREILSKEDFSNPVRLAAAIKSLPLALVAPRPLEEAISTAGGVRFEALDSRLMIRALPGIFCAGEMLDWEAPTGGYLLTACLASGRVAGAGSVAWLRKRQRRSE
jgi:uncharacterized flavoprotein (TIGR03862 family)